MAADIITRLLCDSTNYQQGVRRAKNSLKELNVAHEASRNIISGAVSTIGRFAASVGIAKGATELFAEVIRGSQTTSDEWDRVMRSCKSSVENFFSALSTGDFSAFSLGLDNIIQKAREAQTAIDQLGNAAISYGYFSAKNNADFQEQIAVLRDAEATDEQRIAAQQRIKEILSDQKELASQFQQKSQNAISKLVVEGNTLDASQISRDTIDKVLRTDISAAGETQKAQWAAQYADYQKQVAAAKLKNTTWTTQSTSYGTTSTAVVDYDQMKKDLAPLNDKYFEAIAYNEILVKKNDEWLKGLVGIQQAADNADRSYASMVKTANRANSAAGKTSSSTVKNTAGIKTTEEQWAAPKMTTNENGYEISERLKAGLASAQKYENQEPVVTELQFLEGTQQYQTELGKKAMDYLNGGPIPIVPIEMEMEEDPGDSGLADMYENAEAKLKSYQSQLEKTGSAAQSVGKMFSSAGQLAEQFGEEGLATMMNIGGNIAQMIAELSSLAIASGVAQGAKMPYPYNLAAMATVVSTVMGIIGSLNYAEGGVIPGSNFHDGVQANLSSGEMVINQHDQNRLFSAIKSGDFGGGGSSRAVITGEQIVTAVNNYGRRSGRGVILKG